MQYSVIVNYAHSFHLLRHLLCGSDFFFAQSLSKCEPLETTGGKSGANFLISADKKYLLKQINRAEASWFKSDGDSLFWYLSRTLFPQSKPGDGTH